MLEEGFETGRVDCCSFLGISLSLPSATSSPKTAQLEMISASLRISEWKLLKSHERGRSRGEIRAKHRSPPWQRLDLLTVPSEC